jgi:PAS domain S-box-containing protein
MREGKIIGLTSVARDVTERRQAEEALRESEEKYRLTFSSVSDVIYTIDSGLRISSITPNVEKFLGYKADELINRPFQDLTFLTPESLEKAASDITRVIAGEPISASVYEFVAKDGKSVFGEISGSPMIHEGKISGVSAVARDITERIQMEKELRE